MVKDASEVIGLNRRQRNKMAVVKEGLPVGEVIIQEGVRTFETIDGAVAEPVFYMMDHYVVGGFYRVHTARGSDENLNAPGMEFRPWPSTRLATFPIAIWRRMPCPTGSTLMALLRVWLCLRLRSKSRKCYLRPMRTEDVAIAIPSNPRTQPDGCRP
jgi:hypothetical protein